MANHYGFLMQHYTVQVVGWWCKLELQYAQQNTNAQLFSTQQ